MEAHCVLGIQQTQKSFWKMPKKLAYKITAKKTAQKAVFVF